MKISKNGDISPRLKDKTISKIEEPPSTGIKLIIAGTILLIIGVAWQVAQAKGVEENQEISTEVISSEVEEPAIISNIEILENLPPESVEEIEEVETTIEEVIASPASVQEEIVIAEVMPATSIEQIIIDAANRYGVDPNKMLAIARCESGLNPLATNWSNSNGSADFGLYQFNSIHGFSQEQMYDPYWSADQAAQWLAGGSNAWYSSSSCHGY